MHYDIVRDLVPVSVVWKISGKNGRDVEFYK